MKFNVTNKEINEIRLIGINNEQLGIKNINEAIKIAKKKKADLIEINKKTTPPVYKIINYGKFLYKKNKLKKKNIQKTKQIKEIKFRPNTDKNDYNIKLKNIINFIEKGIKVKITLRFKGREYCHKNIGLKILNKIKENTSNIAIVELFNKKIEGKNITMILIPKKNNI